MNDFTSAELLEFIQNEFPRLTSAMMKSSHHYDEDHLNPYHLEGGVWTHTLMVFQQAEEKYPNDKINLLSSLLHDFGKPDTRIVYEDRKHIGYFGHSGVSNFKIVNVLNHPFLGLIYEEKVLITQVINLHIDLFQGGLINTDTPITYLSKKGQELYNAESAMFEQLCRLGICDDAGRYTSIERPSGFHNFLAKIDLEANQGRESIPNPKENKKTKSSQAKTPNLTILIGPPNSGKSTWRKSLDNSTIVVSRDDTMMELYPGMSYDEVWKKQDTKKVDTEVNLLFKKAISKERDIVLDRTNMSKKSRRSWLSQVPNKYNKKAVVFMTDLEVIKQRNIFRSKSEGKHIPSKVLLDMCKSFSIPTHTEFDQIEYVFYEQ